LKDYNVVLYLARLRWTEPMSLHGNVLRRQEKG